MSRVAVRLFLVACLVLNGIGNAMAAAAMPATTTAMSQYMGTQVQVDAAEAELPSAGACDHADAPVTPLDGGTSTSEAPHPAGCGEDCCFQGACHCPCMQGAHVALLDVPAVPAFPGRTEIASVYPAGHAAPLLHIAIRPPIG